MHDRVVRCTLMSPGMTTARPVLPVSITDGKLCRPTPAIVIVIRIVMAMVIVIVIA